MSEKSVYVLDDDMGVREALHHLLTSHGYRMISFGGGSPSLGFPKLEGPSCLILDLEFADKNGFDLEQRRKWASVMPIICLTESFDIRATVKAMREGANEVLAKPVEEDELISAVRMALSRAEGEWVDLEILRQIHNRYASLTHREREVLPFIVDGFLNKQTAYELGTSEITIRIHRARIMRKMRADSLADLVRIAWRIGIPSRQNPTVDKTTTIHSLSLQNAGRVA